MTAPMSPRPSGDDVPTDDDAAAEGVGAPRRVPVAAIVSGIVGVVVVGLIAVFLTVDTSGGDDRRATVNQRLELAGPTLSGGTYDLADKRGSFVLVNFFATWCVPCRIEHPELVRFSETYEGTGEASVVSVAYQDDESDLRSFFQRLGGEWPVVVGPGVGRIATDFGVVKLPESYLVDPSGLIVEKFVGGVTAAEVVAAMDRHREAR